MSLLLQILFWVSMSGNDHLHDLLRDGDGGGVALWGAETAGGPGSGDVFAGGECVEAAAWDGARGWSGISSRFFEQDYPEFELLFCARHERMRVCNWRGVWGSGIRRWMRSM